MNRRRFMSLLGMGVAGIAIAEAIPLGRVWSFPKEIVVAAPISNVRFLRAWDPSRRMLINRVDMLYGFGLLDCSGSVPEIVELIKTHEQELIVQ